MLRQREENTDTGTAIIMDTVMAATTTERKRGKEKGKINNYQNKVYSIKI